MRSKDRKDKKEKEMPCQACFGNYYDEDAFFKLVCTNCEIAVHRYCYSPQTKTKFKCDECKQQAKSKDHKPHCSVCGGNREKGILKNVGSDEWMHVLCAFSSTRAHLNSYKNLAFLATGNPPSRKPASKNRCKSCNFQRVGGSACSISDCTNYHHLTCLLNNAPKGMESQQQYQPFLTIGLLDKHENSLFQQIKLNSDLKEHFKGFDLLNEYKKQIRYFVCSIHNGEEYFKWCTCNMGSSTTELKECEKCARWFHIQCDKFQTICTGCSKNDIYRKNAKLPELIKKAIEAQQAPQLDKTHIKYLDHFCLKLSQDLLKIISKHELQIEKYYLRKKLQNAQKCPQKNDQQAAKILQILYCLVKKQIKSDKEFTTQDIEQMISSLSSKNSKFQVKDKSQRIERNYKHFLQQVLAKMKKDGTQDIKMKLTDFIMKNKQLRGRKQADIAKDICELMKLFKDSQGWKALQSDISSSQNNLLKLFYQLDLSQQGTTAVLEALKIVLLAKQNKCITQQEYQQINKIINLLPLQVKQKNKLVQIFSNLIQDLPLRKLYKQKGYIIKELQFKSRQRKNREDLLFIQKRIHQNNLFTEKILKELQTSKAQAAVLKLGIIKQQHSNLQFSQKQLKRYLQKLFKLDEEYHLLSKDQRKKYQQINHRRHFYFQIRQHQKRMLSQGLEHMEVEENAQRKLITQEDGCLKEEERQIKLLTIEQEILNIIEELNYKNQISANFLLHQLNNLALHRVSLNPKLTKALRQIATKIISVYNIKLTLPMAILSASLIERLNRIAIYLNIEEEAGSIIEKNGCYSQWKYQLQNKFSDIPSALQSHKSCTELLKLVQSKIGQTIQKIDMSKQMGKLRAIRMWALLSLKLIPKHKATITSIQHTKSLMDKLSYPQNELRKKVQLLDVQSRDLNKKIGSILQKPKPVEHQIYEEISLITSKMSLEQGFQLKNRMQLSQLDVQIQLQALMQEINQFQSFPKEGELRKYIISQRAENVDSLITLRRKIFENAFGFKDIEGYFLLITRIAYFKCQSGVPNSKKEYFSQMRFGVENGSKLYQRTMSRQKAYKQVQKAQKEYFSSKNKMESLLPPDCKRLLQDLKDDPQQSAKIARWAAASQKLKEQYRSIRKLRLQLSQLIIVQNQLLKIPINNRETLNQISKIKRQIEELSKKVKTHTLNGDPLVVLESPFTEDILNKYLSLGVRTQYLDRFHQIFIKNKIIMDYGRNIRMQNYAQFSRVCREYSEIQRNSQVYRVREDVFNKVAQVYLQAAQPWMQIGYTLLGEGGYLLSYPSKTTEIIKKIFEINGKFNKWQPEVMPARMEAQQEEQQSQENEFGDEDDLSEQLAQDEQDQDSQLIGSIDDDSEMDEESSDSEQPRIPRKRPHAEVVNLDDD